MRWNVKRLLTIDGILRDWNPNASVIAVCNGKRTASSMHDRSVRLDGIHSTMANDPHRSSSVLRLARR